MIRITLAFIICTCVIITASALSLPGNAFNQTEEILIPSENHSVVKRNVFLNIWEGIQNFFHNALRGFFAKQDEDEQVGLNRGMAIFTDISNALGSVKKFFGLS